MSPAGPTGGTRIGVDVHGAEAVVASLELADRMIAAGTTKVVRDSAELLRTRVRAGASGRPGPRVQTGDYRRGIATNHGRGVGPTGKLVPVSQVRSNSPQAWRLEKGFVGRDVLGRFYNQPAYPHWGPALDYVEPRMQAELVAMLDAVERAAGAGSPIDRGSSFGGVGRGTL